MRGLSADKPDSFMEDLKSGFLSPLLAQVKNDQTLCLEIRDDYVNVYYRGGNLLKLARKGTSRYEASFDTNYARNTTTGMAPLAALPGVVGSPAEVATWITSFPQIKQLMDFYFSSHPKEEREIQQMILRDNNFSSIGRSTDYFICDIEFANEEGRFDMTAVHWPSDSAIRKANNNRRLVLIEVKNGDGALDGTAGLHDHVRNINAFVNQPGKVRDFKKSMVTVFNQKRELGLINCEKDLGGFSDDPPLLLLILVNHDPDKSKLRDLLNTIPPSPHAEIRLATSNFMGYGLYDPAIYLLDEFRSRFASCIGPSR